MIRSLAQRQILPVYSLPGYSGPDGPAVLLCWCVLDLLDILSLLGPDLGAKLCAAC